MLAMHTIVRTFRPNPNTAGTHAALEIHGPFAAPGLAFYAEDFAEAVALVNDLNYLVVEAWQESVLNGEEV